MDQIMEFLPFLIPLVTLQFALFGYTLYHILTHKTWQELSDYQLFGSFTVTAQDAKEYLYSFSKTRRVHRFQSFKVNLYI